MIEYEEDWLVTLLFRYEGSVLIRSLYFALPSALLSLLVLFIEDWRPGTKDDLGITELDSSTLWSVMTIITGSLLSFRTSQALSRFWEGTGLLHQMRGEWFDSVSCCVTFSRMAVQTKPKEVHEFRHTLVRLMSLCHGSALEEIADGEQTPSNRLETIDVFGLDTSTLMHLKECKEVHGFNRVEVLLHLIQSLITQNHDAGVLSIPPPIISRVYQTLSRGFVNLLNAKKITDTKFPFPYAQLIAVLLFSHMLLTPLYLSHVVDHKVWSPLFTFLPLLGFFACNFVSIELENPFGEDDNDLPLTHFQSEMNRSLLMLLHDNADHVPSMSSKCVGDYSNLIDQMRDSKNIRAVSLSNIAISEGESRSSWGIMSRMSNMPFFRRASQATTQELSHGATTELTLPPTTEEPGEEEGSDPSKDAHHVSEGVVSSVPPQPETVEAAPSVEKLGEKAGATSSVDQVDSNTSGLNARTPSGPSADVLNQSVADFRASLSHWMSVVEGQVGLLNESFDALRSLSESIPVPAIEPQLEHRESISAPTLKVRNMHALQAAMGIAPTIGAPASSTHAETDEARRLPGKPPPPSLSGTPSPGLVSSSHSGGAGTLDNDPAGAEASAGICQPWQG